MMEKQLLVHFILIRCSLLFELEIGLLRVALRLLFLSNFGLKNNGKYLTQVNVVIRMVVLLPCVNKPRLQIRHK